jgi:hypothetical protein
MGLIGRTYYHLTARFFYPIWLGHVGLYLVAAATQSKPLATIAAFVFFAVGYWSGPKIWKEEME